MCQTQTQLVLQVFPHESAHGVGNNHLQPAIEFINENLDQDLKLAEIAAVVNMSQFYFARMFKQVMGISPHQYVVGRRIERAQQLLTKSQLSVAEVAIDYARYHEGKHQRTNYHDWGKGSRFN